MQHATARRHAHASPANPCTPSPSSAIAVPLEDVVAVQEQHRAYLRSLKEDGTLIASGPMDPRTGGALLLRVPDDDVHGALDAVRDGDPYVTFGVAQYELIPWAVNTGKEGLDSLKATYCVPCTSYEDLTRAWSNAARAPCVAEGRPFLEWPAP